MAPFPGMMGLGVLGSAAHGLMVKVMGMVVSHDFYIFTTVVKI